MVYKINLAWKVACQMSRKILFLVFGLEIYVGFATMFIHSELFNFSFSV